MSPLGHLFRKYANVLIDDCEFINVSSTKNGGAIFADMYIDGAHDGGNGN